MGTAVTFSGGLSSKKIDDLQDIAYALGISDEGHKDSLLSSIKAELERRPELQTKIQFSGLYTTRGQKRKATAAPTDKNLPPANYPHLNQSVPLPGYFSNISAAGPSQPLGSPPNAPNHRLDIYYPPQYIQFTSTDTNHTKYQPHL